MVKIKSTTHFFSNSMYNRESNAAIKNEQYDPPEIRTVHITGPARIIGT